MSNETHDYSKGLPRRHHTFFIEEGDVCLQVENAIFKVHRFFLAHRSSVLKQMLHAPQPPGGIDGTEGKPIKLTGDKVEGWEAFFQSIYTASFLKPDQTITKQALIAVLRLAHKYCMESVEGEILSHLQQAANNKEGHLDLLVASQVVGSSVLHQQAVEGLAPHKLQITIEEARVIGLESLHAIMISSSGPPTMMWSQRLNRHF
ncbi:hypothetical protein M408DRAFT_328561 [Serendipita vermifera MAFF 305830]|uniref:BTB domain-containing protein n=1 Tax=Serendipita vermifera MAFF 305830 TaxID=933852 RepID=A0A0C3BE30_SERVB|nr:hypothetical protein M408DRAFT_328561 [Serendipita vermifera MAFF 305830]